MSEFKYEEAVLCKNNVYKILSIEQIRDCYAKNKSAFFKKIDGNLFCPECHKVQLTLVDGNFLRGHQNQKHDSNCSKSVPEINQSVFNSFCDNSKNSKSINNKLEKLIDKMLKQNTTVTNPLVVSVNKNGINQSIANTSSFKNASNIRRIPIKSLCAPFDKEDFDKWKLFYGNVDIEIKERTNKITNNSFYSLDIYQKNENKRICSLAMSLAVVKHLVNLYKLSINNRIKNVYVAFASKLNKKSIYINGQIIHTDYIVIDGV